MPSDFQMDLKETFLGEAEELLSSWEADCLKLEAGFDGAVFDSLFRAAHTLKGSSKTVGLNEFGQFVHRIEDVIRIAQTKDVKSKDLLIEILFKSHALMTNWLESDQADETEVKNIFQSVNAFFMKEDMDPPSEGPAAATQSRSVAPLKKVEKSDPSDPNKKQSKGHGNEVIRVKRDKIDDIIKAVGEMGTQLSIVQHQFQAKRYDSKESQSALDFCMKYSRQLQELSLSLSMQPLDRFFQRLERTCKDVARMAKKEIKVVKVGSEIELDKTVLDRIADPFVHILRNAADHGIETPDEREKAGKPRNGTVTLKADQEAGMVVVTVKDDGKGLDHERILRKAVDKGLVRNPDDIKKDDIYNLILLPGFSTKDQVTEVSGRGVGLDVVNSTINSLGGSLTIKSDIGKGTLFKVSLPTNFSLVESIIVEVGGNRYGVPLKDFSEVVDLEDLKIQESVSGDRFFYFRGQIVSLQSFGSYLRNSQKEGAEKSFSAALINRSMQTPIAFEVDRLYDRQNLFVKPLKGNFDEMLGVSGTTILPDGKAGLILNLSDMAREYQMQFKDVRHG